MSIGLKTIKQEYYVKHTSASTITVWSNGNCIVIKVQHANQAPTEITFFKTDIIYIEAAMRKCLELSDEA